MKCDSDPVCCANCKSSGSKCLQIDRVTKKQYPRGEMERVYQRCELLESHVQIMQLQLANCQRENDRMKQQIRQVSSSQAQSQGHRQSQMPSLPDSKSASSSVGRRSQSLNVSAMGTSAALSHGLPSSMNAPNGFLAANGASCMSKTPSLILLALSKTNTYSTDPPYPTYSSNFSGITEEPVVAS